MAVATRNRAMTPLTSTTKVGQPLLHAHEAPRRMHRWGVPMVFALVAVGAMVCVIAGMLLVRLFASALILVLASWIWYQRGRQRRGETVVKIDTTGTHGR